MAERKINLPETKGQFQIKGIVTGVSKNEFYKEGETKTTHKPERSISFGVQVNKDSTIYVSLKGYTKDEVIFANTKTRVKEDQKKIKWDKRASFKEEDYQVIGINVGLEKYLDTKGKERNKTLHLVEYDACDYISKNLKDGMAVFVKGNINYYSSVKDDGTKTRGTNYYISQISLSTPDDFEAEDFVERNAFKQKIVFMETRLDEQDPKDKKGIMSSKVITYNGIEDVEFVVRDKDLFGKIKKNLKPYSAFEVEGKINNKVIVEEVEDDDDWGEKSVFDEAKRTFIRELIVTTVKAKKDGVSLIDTETYSQSKMDEAIRALREFGEEKTAKADTADNWGNVSSDDDDDWN